MRFSCLEALALRRVLTILAALASLAGCAVGRMQQEEAARVVQLPGKGVTVLAAGDIADCGKYLPSYSGAAKTAALMAPILAQDPAAVVLSLGDHTYPVGLLQEFHDCYEPTWGLFKERTYPVPGNHEYYTPHAIGYYTYFGKRAGEPRKGYYSFRLGEWLLVALNSNLKAQEHAAQLDWLKDELAKNKHACTLAFWHHPLFSSGGHGSNPKMESVWRLLQEAGAELVLASHDHDYERFAPQDSQGQRDDARGIRQFVVGTGGAQLTPLGFKKWNSERSDNQNYGVLKLVLKQGGYEWDFLSVPGASFTDRGAALCH